MFEYMAVGKPIVGEAFPTITEVLTDGENGYLVEPANYIALRDGLTRALSDGVEHTVGIRAVQDVGAYTWERRAEAIYQNLEGR